MHLSHHLMMKNAVLLCSLDGYSWKNVSQSARLPDTLRQHQDADIASKWNIDNGTLSLSFEKPFSMSQKVKFKHGIHKQDQKYSNIHSHSTKPCIEVAGLLVCSHTQKTPINCRWGECNHDQSRRPDKWTWAAQNFVLCHKTSLDVFACSYCMRFWVHGVIRVLLCMLMLSLMSYRKMRRGMRSPVGICTHMGQSSTNWVMLWNEW
jgi:hypothetical protein